MAQLQDLLGRLGAAAEAECEPLAWVHKQAEWEALGSLISKEIKAKKKAEGKVKAKQNKELRAAVKATAAAAAARKKAAQKKQRQRVRKKARLGAATYKALRAAEQRTTRANKKLKHKGADTEN